jgi:hypothetical protein
MQTFLTYTQVATCAPIAYEAISVPIHPFLGLVTRWSVLKVRSSEKFLTGKKINVKACLPHHSRPLPDYDFNTQKSK